MSSAHEDLCSVRQAVRWTGQALVFGVSPRYSDLSSCGRASPSVTPLHALSRRFPADAGGAAATPSPHSRKVNPMTLADTLYQADTTTAADRSQNLEDTFLNRVCKKTPLMIFLMSGVKLQGRITQFDDFCVELRRNGHSQLVYKHAISTIAPGLDEFGETLEAAELKQLGY
jgi:host factor-I protein